jgi:carbonic anhydrase
LPHATVSRRERRFRRQTNPFAGILSCADSRIAPEYAFDSSRGDLFVCRVVCNFVNADNLASFEFAVDALKFPLLLVLRHEACGAIKADVGPGRVSAPRPFPFAGRRACAGGHRRTRRFAGEGNTRKRPPKRRVPEDRNADSQRPVDEGCLKVTGGIYRLATGQVELIG